MSVFTTVTGVAIKTANKVKFGAIKHAPEILIGGGIILGVGATIWACKKTLKLPEVMSDHETRSEKVKMNKPDDKKAAVLEVGKTMFKVGQLYVGPIAIGATATAMILGGFGIQRNRYLLMSAANIALTDQFAKYRERTKALVGEEKEQGLYYGIKDVTVNRVAKGEDGQNEIVSSNEKYLETSDDPTIGCSPYAKIFDECNVNWTKDPAANRDFVNLMQNVLNEKIRNRKGYMFANEIYEAFGFPPTKAGQHAGIVCDGIHGDDYLEVKIINCNVGKGSPDDDYFPVEPSMLLDFNFYGNILDFAPIEKN